MTPGYTLLPSLYPRLDFTIIEHVPVESKTRTYHGRVGSERTAGWRGGVEQDQMPSELFAWEKSVPRNLRSIAERRLNDFPEVRTNEILCKPMKGPKPALDPQVTHGSSPVHHRFDPLFMRRLSVGREAIFLPSC